MAGFAKGSSEAQQIAEWERSFREKRGSKDGDPVPVSLSRPTHANQTKRNVVRLIGPAPAGRTAASVSRPMSTVEAARAVLDKAALASDIATVGLAAGGVTAPIAGAAKTLGWIAEGGLGLVNFYDAKINGNRGPLDAQIASLPSHLLPGGRALQKGLKTVRGPVGLLRDGAGKFRSSVLNNEAIEKAGQVVTERYIGAIADGIFNRPK